MRIKTTKRQSHSKFQFRLKPAYAAVLLAFSVHPAHANPLDPTVVSGQASFATSGNTLTVTNTPGAIINWQGFSIGANEITRFAQQSASSAVLNRVISNNPSSILGTLQSNGRVFLINPNGIVFGAGSVVDVAGLVASTLNLSDADFLAGRNSFTQVPGAASISNAGDISAQDGGQIFLIAPDVENTGVITAPNGEILLAAGHSVDLVSTSDPNLRVNITAPAGDATNVGQLIASSGSLGLFGTVVRNSGAVSADSATMQGGKIVFRSTQRTDAGGTVSAQGVGGGEIKMLSDMQTGIVSVTGTLDASAPVSGDGGFVETSAAHVNVAPLAKISASAASGQAGQWLIDPADVFINAVTQVGGTFTAGGTWLPSATPSYISTGTIEGALNIGTNVTITTVNAGLTGAGDINVQASIAKTGGTAASLTLLAENNINFAIGAGISSTSGALNVVLRSDADANNTGTVTFAGTNTLNALAGGRVDLFYNPVSYTDAATKSDSLGNPYSAVFGATPFTAWMLVNDVGIATGGTLGLQAMNTNLAGNYALGKDFTAATSTWNAGAGFAPIGNISTPFTGRFDGLGHTINGLTINRPTTSYVGLFGYTNASTMKNVSLTNVNISGYSYVGSLVGWHQGNLAFSSNASGTVTGFMDAASLSGNHIGGLVGINYNSSTIDTCTAGSTVQGDNYVGGLVGTSQSSTINNSSASGAVTGTQWYVGGSVGDSYITSITNGTATGNVAGVSFVGGLVGRSGYSSSITNGIASGTVSGSNDVGGLVGLNAFSIDGSHATGSVTGTGAGTNVGGSVGNNYYAQGSTFSMRTYGAVSNSYASTGTVTGVSNVGGLVGYNFLYNTITISYAGGAVTGNSNVGGLVGNNERGDITTAYATGTVTGNGVSTSLGGLVGNNSGTITNSYVTSVSVTGVNNVGGLVGYNWLYPTYANDINGSYVSAGSVTGTGTNVGGLVGNNTGTLTNSHYNINGVTVNGANIVTLGGLYNDNLFNAQGIGQYSDWLIGKSLNIADYTAANGGSFGDGGANIYTISNVSPVDQRGLKDMLGFADNSLYTFTLTASVDLTGLSNFYIPILASDFNGAGFTISNLNLAQNNSDLGMFGKVTSLGSVSNLALQNVTVNSAVGGRIGGLAGSNAGTISNSSVSAGAAGAVTVAGGNQIGGLVGLNSGTISASTVSVGATGAVGVTGVSDVGGLVGSTGTGTISTSSVSSLGGTLSVTGTTQVGGLAGQFISGSIADSHVSAATVAGTVNVGGLVGMSNFGSSITNSYVDSGAVTATVGYIGGLVGLEMGTHTNSFFDIDNVTTNGGNNVTVGGLYNTGGVGQFNDWFNGGLLTPLVITNYASLASLGGGIYGISDQQGMKDMLGFAEDPTYNFSLTTGINLTGMSGYYVPKLAGNFNGNGLTISNLNLTLINDNMGLFGSIASGSLVSNLDLVNVAVSGLINVGAVAGSNYGDIDAVTVSGTTLTVNGATNVGGVVGRNVSSGSTTTSGALSGGNISNSSVNGGTVAASVGGGDVGGLAGWNTGNITNSDVLNTAVSGSNTVGGLVGYNQGAASSSGFWSGIITGSTVTNGSVTGIGGIGSGGIGGLVGNNFEGAIVSSHVINPTVDGGAANSVGGLVGDNGIIGSTGFNWPTGSYSISNSYVSGGTVGSTGNYAGGLVGNNFGAPINASYVDAVVVNGGTSVGGLVGFDSGEGWGGGLGLISNSFVSNTQVTGTSQVGGFVGEIRLPLTGSSGNDNYVAILNSYVSGGTVSGTTNVGGLVGFNDGEISMAYTASGLVSGTTNVGGLIGYNDFSAVVSNSFWDIDTTGQPGGSGFGQDLGYFNTLNVVGLTTVQMMTMSSFTNWSITDTGGTTGMTWRIYEGQTNPLLMSFLTPLTVTAITGSRTYDGTTNGLGVTYSTPPDANLLGTVVADTASPNVGSYTVTPSGLYSTQMGYDISYAGGTVDITSAGLTLLSLSADDASKTYGTTLTFSGTAFTPVGLVGGDFISSLTLTSAGAVNTANAGTYSIDITPGSEVFGQGLASNYSINYLPGVLTVDPAPLTVTADAQFKMYGDLDPTFTYINSALLFTDSLSGSLGRAAGQNVGTYTINQGTLNNPNYAITYVGNNLTITQRGITVVANASTKVYGNADPNSFTVGGAGLATWDTQATVFTGSLSHSGGEDVAGSPYMITEGTLAANANYSYNSLTDFTSSTLTITQAPLTVTANATSKILNTADPLLTYMVSGLKFTDTAANTLTGSLSRVAGETVGTYQINQNSLTLSLISPGTNYTMNYVSASFTILVPTVIDEIVNTSLLFGPDTGSAQSTSSSEKDKATEDILAVGDTKPVDGTTAQPLPMCN